MVAWPVEPVFRIGRASAPVDFSCIDPTEAVLDTAGNRFDVPGGGVLYGSSQLAGCFGETLARFRPSPAILAAIGEDAGYMNAGCVPRAWRLDRVVVQLHARDALPFLDVETPATCTALTQVLADELGGLGLNVPLDVAIMRGHRRRLTRLVANWAYTQTDTDGRAVFSGIRYRSRICNDWINWAIFDGTTVEHEELGGIDLGDESLRRVARDFDLTCM